jgi:asparagine synthase (glutamine-hydrolysing)
MCGITGIINHESFSNIKMMVEAQKRRGPDNSSFESFPSIQSSLGHNRLTIIDVSDSANQPFYDFSKKHVIVFNGEVYNYKELKNELEKKGHIFRTNSDTEVVLLSYLEWGEDCVQRFRGMFAFVILNIVNGSAFFARDRFGIKPLLYTKKDNGILFSSEIKAILASSIVDKKIRNEALYEFLINGSIHQPKTFYKDIFQIPAGHYGKFENGELHIIQYWDIYENTKELKSGLKNISYAEAVIELRKYLEEAARSLAILRYSEQSLKFQGSGILPEDFPRKISKDSKAKCARVLFYIFSKSAIARFPSRGIS